MTRIISQKLRDSARDQDCTLRLVGVLSMHDQCICGCKFRWENWPYTESTQEPAACSATSPGQEAAAYTGEGGVLIRCHDCSAEHCPCLAR